MTFPWQGQHWVLDPIDGTRGFVGMRQYAVCLGLLDGGQVLTLASDNLYRGAEALTKRAVHMPKDALQCHEKLGKGLGVPEKKDDGEFFSLFI